VLVKSDAAVQFIRASSTLDAGVTTSTETELQPLFLRLFSEVAGHDSVCRLPSFLYDRFAAAAGELVGDTLIFETVFALEVYGFTAFDLDARHILLFDSSITFSTAPLDAFIMTFYFQ
jgi:hypothetical protein